MLSAALIVGFVLWLNTHASPHNLPGTEHNRRHAITYAFCHTLTPCVLGNQALRVAYCESGPSLWPWARNGQYLGMFQFGEFARARFGFAWGPWEQARAAYRYYRFARGWSPWTCRWAA